MSQHVLWIDSRESPVIQDYIKGAMHPDPAETIKLDCADFLIFDKCEDEHSCGIERKTIMDFLGSLHDGRIWSQLQRISSAYSHPILLIEGTGFIMSRPGMMVRGKGGQEGPTKGGKVMRSGVETGWYHGAAQMALAKMQRTYPSVVVLWTAGKPETADILRVLYARGKKGCFNSEQ